MNGIQLWEMEWQELECDKTLNENFLYFLHISGPKMTSNDLIGSNIWRHFRPWKMKTTPIFCLKFYALEFLSTYFQNWILSIQIEVP